MKLKIHESKLGSFDKQECLKEASSPLVGLDSSLIISILESNIKERETPVIEKMKKGLLK